MSAFVKVGIQMSGLKKADLDFRVSLNIGFCKGGYIQMSDKLES